jgi:hypothetical protein
MAEHSTVEAIEAEVPEEHPAIRSWRRLWPEGRLQGLEVLKDTRKSRVYRISGAGPAGSAVIAKQCWRETALIERTIYEAILPHLPLPRLHYYGSVQLDDEWCWLFVEDAGREEYSRRIEEHRLLSARWLATMHTSAARVVAASRLPDHGPNYYLARLQSAQAGTRRVLADFTLNTDDRTSLDSIVSQCDLLKALWSQVGQTCETVPRTVVHGDFIGKNMRIRRSPSDVVLLPFDWEFTGWGHPIADLAQFAEVSTASLASQDLSVYRSNVSRFWPRLGVDDIRVLGNLGRIFRLIDAINWACEGIAAENSAAGMEKPLRKLRLYQGWMASAIQAVERRS